MELRIDVPDELVERVARRAAELILAELNRPREPWIGTEQAAEHLASPKSRVYELVSRGEIPHHRDGSRLLFRRSELDAWVEGGGGRRSGAAD